MVSLYSVPEKQIQILQIMMSFYKRSRAIIKQGAPLLKINALPVKEEIVRIKTTISNEDAGKISEVEHRMNDQLNELERVYKKADLA